MVSAEVDFQIRQMLDILKAKLVKRGIDIKALKEGDVELSGQKAVMKWWYSRASNQTWRETGENDQGNQDQGSSGYPGRETQSKRQKTRRLAGHHCHAQGSQSGHPAPVQ